MVGTELSFEFLNAPDQYTLGEAEFDILGGDNNPVEIRSDEIRTFEVVAVIDDREPGFSIGFSTAFLPESLFIDAIELANEEAVGQEPKFVEYNFFVDDFSQLEDVTQRINDQEGFIANALVLFLVVAIDALVIGLSVFLSLFGFIAFIASVFGIIAVMSISVLERKKEVGILKSIGARDSGIFTLFLMESAMLGVVGWLLGMIIAWVTSLIISTAASIAIQNIESVREGLEVFGIDGFALEFPWWIYLATLGLAVFFTSVSGILPSFSAARQNPVEVLRSE
jgi:ABC-type antimicrobial peptide transport system permease subunit